MPSGICLASSDELHNSNAVALSELVDQFTADLLTRLKTGTRRTSQPGLTSLASSSDRLHPFATGSPASLVLSFRPRRIAIIFVSLSYLTDLL